jgi:mannose-6-phosphate isomerase-like protein (cupin superfamily)
MLAGEAVVRTPSGDIDAMEGDIVVAEPGTTYTVETTGDTPSVHILVTDTNA